jgi:undecaprenyl-diphosphatase
MFNTILKFIKKYQAYIFLVLIIFLALKVFIPQLSTLKDGLLALKQADFKWVLIGLVAFWVGLPILAKQYQVLAKKFIPFGLTLKVQIAGLFVGKLLPSSLGTLTLNSYYLIYKNHTASQVSSVMLVNAITSGLAYVALMALFFSIFATINNSPITILMILLITIVGLLVIALLLHLTYKIPFINNFAKIKLANFIQQLSDYKNHKNKIFSGIWLNGMGSLTSMFALYASAQALGLDIQLYQVFMAYTFGNIVAGVVPVPGGLGATEAGLYATFIALGYDEASSIATVFLYRLITFWIPVLPGIWAFINLKRDVLKDFKLSLNNTN